MTHRSWETPPQAPSLRGRHHPLGRCNIYISNENFIIILKGKKKTKNKAKRIYSPDIMLGFAEKIEYIINKSTNLRILLLRQSKNMHFE